jgi:hypothetical protein
MAENSTLHEQIKNIGYHRRRFEERKGRNREMIKGYGISTGEIEERNH